MPHGSWPNSGDCRAPRSNRQMGPLRTRRLSLATLALLLVAPAPSQQASSPQTPTIRTTVDEVILDLIVRDKKGKPVTDLKPSDLTVLDNGAKQTPTGFRLVTGSEAVEAGGAKKALDPLRQTRLVTLAFESVTDVSQRKLTREAALDLVRGSRLPNVYFSVVVIGTRLILLREFTSDQAALTKAIEQATGGLGGPGMTSESEAIQSQLRRNLAGSSGIPPEGGLRAAASAAAGQPVSNGAEAIQAKLASVMLEMLRLDASAATRGARLTLSALRTLVDGQRSMPGRKSVLFFTGGMYLAPELDAPFEGVIGAANRTNVTFYSVDCRGVMVAAQTAGAREQLSGAAAASATTVARTSGAVTKDEVMSSDNAETSGRANVQEAIRNLAESTGGFLIGDSNDLRNPLRRVHEEIASYYEVAYTPGIQNYDGSFHKISTTANRKDLVIQGRSGYFALPPDVRGSGVQPFEGPLLQLLSTGKAAEDVRFRVGAFLLQPGKRGTDVLVLLELPLHELRPTAGRAPNTQEAHCSLAILVKNEQGEVVEKLAHDRSFTVTAEQLKRGNFLDRLTISAPPGKYTVEAAVMDQNGGKVGVVRSQFTAPAWSSGVGVSSLALMRSFTPNAKPDAADPFRFQGGAITPALDMTVNKEPNAMLRLFFTVYQDQGISAKPTVEVEILQSGKSLTKAPLQLPPADAQGRIPYLMTIPAASIPPGEYEVRAAAAQGSSTAQAAATIRIVP